MVNIFRLSKNVFMLILVIAAIWIIYKKNESMYSPENDESKSKEISTVDKVMIGFTSILEELNPSSSFTRQLTKQKNTVINHL